MRGRREGLSRIMLAILLLACISMQGVGIVKASPGKPTIGLVPQVTNLAPPGTFNINVKVTDITITPMCKGLYDWDIFLQFNASILNVTSVTMPDPYFLAGYDTAWKIGIAQPMIDNTRGSVSAGDAIMPDFEGNYPPQGATGSGLLASITFKVKVEGASLLYFNDTALGTFLGTPPNQYTYPIDHDRLHGFFEYPKRNHDTAVTAVTASPTSVPIGNLVSINATVKNEGEVAEALSITVYYNNTAIQTQTFLNLAASAEKTLTFTWDTKGVAAGTYAIKAKADLVDRNHPEVSLAFLETDKMDNTLADGQVTVLSPPKASFTYSPSKPITGETVTFNASASKDPDGTIASYKWDFDDGNITTTADPVITHIYTAHGTYNVNLLATDNDGLTGTAKTDVTVLAHDIAVTGITTSHIAAMPGVPVTINVTVKNEGDFTETFSVTVYYDNTTIGTQTVTNLALSAKTTLTFAWNTASVDLGPYTIKAVASNVKNETNIGNNVNNSTITIAPYNTVSHPIEVGGVTFHVVTKSNSTVSERVQLIEENKEISFNVTGPEGTVGYCNVTIPKKLLSVNATHPWLVLLDGVNITDITSIVEDAAHTFLYFTYNFTNTQSTRKVEIIGAILATPTPPVAIFTPSTTSAYVGDPITFDASSSYDPDGEIVSYQWDFDDSTTEIYMKGVNLTDTATHKYTAAGLYTATLTVTDDDGLTDMAATNMTISWVHDVVVTKLTVSPNKVKIGERVYINVTVANKGNFPDPESFTVKVYYDNSVVGFGYVTNLAPSEETTLNITWYTTNVAAGTYTIKANATLADDTNPGNNELVYGTVTIEKLSSTISIYASPTTITFGEGTTITGSITPLHKNVVVTIQYRPAGGSWSVLTTTTTDWSGQYSYVWTPTTLGTYELKSSWEGDATTSEATSNVIIIMVVESHDITLNLGGVNFHVKIESNSTVSNFQLIHENKEIRFNVTGPAGTVGYCNVTIPITLLGGPYTVQVDGLLITPEETTNGTHTFLYFTYSHSTHTVKIKGATIAPAKHDVTVVNVTPSQSKVTVGELVSISVTVKNKGEVAETFSVTAYYDNTAIQTQTVTNLAPSAETTLTFTWDTKGVAAGTYATKAVASTITGEIDTTNNELIGGTITVAEPTAIGILLYVAAGGAAVIVILAIAFYFLRARKQGVKDTLEIEKSSKVGQQHEKGNVHKCHGVY